MSKKSKRSDDVIYVSKRDSIGMDLADAQQDLDLAEDDFIDATEELKRAIANHAVACEDFKTYHKVETCEGVDDGI